MRALAVGQSLLFLIIMGAAEECAHVMWHCPPAQAVRALLQPHLPSSTPLSPQHLWLLRHPALNTHTGVLGHRCPGCPALHFWCLPLAPGAATSLAAAVVSMPWLAVPSTAHCSRPSLRQPDRGCQGAHAPQMAARRAVTETVAGVHDCSWWLHPQILAAYSGSAPHPFNDCNH